ncbi:MAG: HDOD domain-containing protein [Gammaproteobacteria bacterium]
MATPATLPATGARQRLEDIPRPTAAALRVLAACADEDAELPAVAALVAADPILAADLLRVVNSAYFGLGHNVTSLGHAVSLLGLRALRNRVVCLTVRSAMQGVALRKVDAAAFAEDSLRRGVAARCLAGAAGLDRDDAFTAGLLQDLGLLVLLARHEPIGSTQWATLRTASPEARLSLEHTLFGATHDSVLADLAMAWHLPATLVDAIRCHHECSPGMALAQTLAAADLLTWVYASGGDAAAVEATLARLAADFGMADEPARQCLDDIPVLVEQAAAGLGIAVPAQRDLATLSNRLNMRLAEDNVGYQEMNWRLQQALRERDELAATLAAELEIAREIQCSLLPSPTAAQHSIWARNVAARDLSGDFYDYFSTRDGRLLFNLGDVSGKGLTAALLMAKTCSLFRCLGRRIERLDEIIAIINDEICETSVRGMFVTMVAGSYDAATQQVEIISAGHPPPLLLRRGQGIVQVPGTDLPPLGILPGIEFQSRTLSLDKASLYLYSDGISEAVTSSGEELGIRGLARLIASCCDLPAAARLDSIIDAVAAGDCPRRDDITLAVLDPTG